MKWNQSIQDEQDGLETAKNMFGIDFKLSECIDTNVDGFESLGAKNHRARKGIKRAEEAYPVGDRPRGDADIDSVNWNLENDVRHDPVMVVKLDNGEYHVVDGVHRLVSAYITNAPIRYCLYTAVDGKTGGSSTYINNHNAPAEKDTIIAKLIPEQISECALYLGKKPGEPCSSDGMVSAVGAVIGVNGKPAEVITKAKEKLGCDTELCVLSKLENQLGREAVRREIRIVMKIRGPTDVKLLSNYDIDHTLQQWSNRFRDFFPYNFHMLNYTQYCFRDGEIINKPDTLATIQWKDLYMGKVPGAPAGGYRCCGCIINTDRYQGRGKHWMALFADARGKDVWTVEFFNSSGNAPAPEWINWMVKTRDQMEDIAKAEGKRVKVEIVKVCDIRHQQSRTECGVYSLFYIWARLNGTPVEYFRKSPVPDQLMMEFRQHLFNDPNKIVTTKFDYNQYRQKVRLEWE